MQKINKIIQLLKLVRKLEKDEHEDKSLKSTFDGNILYQKSMEHIKNYIIEELL